MRRHSYRQRCLATSYSPTSTPPLLAYTVDMVRRQAYQYELLPDGDQRRRMRRFAGSCRFVFNKALALQKERYERGEN